MGDSAAGARRNARRSLNLAPGLSILLTLGVLSKRCQKSYHRLTRLDRGNYRMGESDFFHRNFHQIRSIFHSKTNRRPVQIIYQNFRIFSYIINQRTFKSRVFST